MTQNKKTQERLPNRRNEINTFSVFRLAFLRTWTSFYHSLFSLVFFRLIWMSLCEWKCEYVRAMFFVCLFVRFHTIVLHRGKVDTSTWRFRNRVSLLLLVVCAFFFLLFFGEIALSFIFLCSSQFSPICAGWCLDDGNEAHTHSREEKKRETKSNKWKKVERKQNCDGFYLPYCMCGDRSVAWEWSNSHVYWAFNRCVLFFFVLLRLHLILRCAFVQREFSFCQTGREASSKIVEPLDGFFSPIPLSLTTFAVFVLTLSLSLPEFFPHWSFFLVFSFSPFFFVCASCALARVYFVSVIFPFFRWIVNCYCIWESRKCAFMLNIYIHIAELRPVSRSLGKTHVDIDATEYQNVPWLLFFLFSCAIHNTVWSSRNRSI